ncbi:MAG: adenylate kinase [Candidatus Anstonellales archaeon]
MIVITGLPGAGKTTVLNLLKEKGYFVVNFGDLMYEMALKDKLVSNRDEMRKKLSARQTRELQIKVARKLSKLKPAILDTHATVRTPEGYFPGLPLHVLRLLKVKAFVLITAKPEEILLRRKEDPTRKRDDDTLEDIEEQDTINKAFIASYSAYKGVPAMLVRNEQGKQAKAAEVIERLLK